jgi:amidohydrolase
MDILQFRRDLHRHPELSGHESDTAWRVREYFRALQPDETIEHLGGAGLAFVFRGRQPGPTVMLRCELDAVPVSEPPGRHWRSMNVGVSHACGHDGHMAILAEVGTRLASRRPESGRVVLLFQPAEENGLGALAVLNDPGFGPLRPDFAFALHNLPGRPLGEVSLRLGSFSCASRGLLVGFGGETAHAAEPESGKSPASAMCATIEALSKLPDGLGLHGEVAFATVVGARLGERAFGVAPGEAEVWATLRAESDASMEHIVEYAESFGRECAARDGLDVEFSYEDVYPAVVNDPGAIDLVRRAAGELAVREMQEPYRWSEDFGHFTATTTGALFGIGAGIDVPALHSSKYDFPDSLIPVAADLFVRLIDLCER